MISRSLLSVCLLSAIVPGPTSAQERDSLRVVVPVIDTLTMDRCSWTYLPVAKGQRVPLGLADATWLFPSGSTLVEDRSTRSAPARTWVNVDTTFWLHAERGPLARHNTIEFLFGPWTSLVTQFYYESDKDNPFSIGCSHCTEILNRCFGVVQDRLLIMAWGGGPAVSEYTRTDYQTFAAFELGTDDWLVVWGGGRTPEASVTVRSLIHSVRF